MIRLEGRFRLLYQQPNVMPKNKKGRLRAESMQVGVHKIIVASRVSLPPSLNPPPLSSSLARTLVAPANKGSHARTTLQVEYHEHNHPVISDVTRRSVIRPSWGCEGKIGTHQTPEAIYGASAGISARPTAVWPFHQVQTLALHHCILLVSFPPPSPLTDEQINDPAQPGLGRQLHTC